VTSPASGRADGPNSPPNVHPGHSREPCWRPARWPATVGRECAVRTPSGRATSTCATHHQHEPKGTSLRTRLTIMAGSGSPVPEWPAPTSGRACERDQARTARLPAIRCGGAPPASAVEASGRLLRVLVPDHRRARPHPAGPRAPGGQRTGRTGAGTDRFRLAGECSDSRLPAALGRRCAPAAGGPRSRLRGPQHAEVAVGARWRGRARRGRARLGAVQGRAAIAVPLGLGADRGGVARAARAAWRRLRLPAGGPGGP
jgi:hypothetical protein